jgi:hypothetical protein
VEKYRSTMVRAPCDASGTPLERLFVLLDDRAAKSRVVDVLSQTETEEVPMNAWMAADAKAVLMSERGRNFVRRAVSPLG